MSPTSIKSFEFASKNVIISLFPLMYEAPEGYAHKQYTATLGSYKTVYYKTLERANSYSATPVKGTTAYNLGGFDGDSFDNGLSKNFNGE